MILSSGYTFTPAANGNPGTINFAGVSGFNKAQLLGVKHLPTGRTLYAPLATTSGAFTGSILTLTVDTTGFNAADALQISYASNAIGSPTDPAPASDAATSSLIGLIRRALGYLGTLAGTVKTGLLQAAIQSNAPRISATGPLGAVNATTSLALDGMNTAVLQITGTWVGTISFLASMDGGASYFPVNMVPYGGAAQAGTASANGQWEMACGGLTHVQVVMSAYTSGSATVLLAATSGLKSVRVGNPAGNPLTVTVGTSALPAGAATSAAQNALQLFADLTKSVLSANAITANIVHALPAAPNPYCWFSASFQADQPGTGVIEGSNDGFVAQGVPVASVTLAGGNSASTLSVRTTFAAYRARITNTNGQQGFVTITSSFSAA